MLAHNYQRPEIQDCADLCGDSLELSIRASRTQADMIVFCGVHFMAETASVLCPGKKVILPVPAAGCPMADTISARDLKAMKELHPDAVVVSYVNTTAEVKAESDLCCTSANSVRVINSIPLEREIIMVPDRNLSLYTKKKTGREIHYWNGYCPIHEKLTASKVLSVKRKYPDALFMAHPECRPEVLEIADEVSSTSGMLVLAARSKAITMIVGTETGILYPLSLAAPDKVFLPADPDMVCADMKRISLEDVLNSLENEGPEVKVPKDTADRARIAVKKMLEISAEKDTAYRT